MRHLTPCVLILVAAAMCFQASAGVILTYKMAKGDVLRYQCDTTGDGTINALGRTGPVHMEARFIYVMACTAVDDAGFMTISHRLENVETQASWAGQQIPVALNIPEIITVISPGGTVLSTRVIRPEAPEPSAEGGLMGALGGALAGGSQLDVGQFFGELHGPGFPVEAVEPGKRWQETLRLKTQSGQLMPVTYTTTFLDYAKLTGVNCARLETDYEMPLDLGLIAGPLFNLRGTQRGSQISYFDYEGGKAMRFDGVSDTQVVMETPQLFGSAAGNQSSVSMTMRSNTTVVLK
ncbi:MAG: hypothetical protein HPY44_21225 [Armatimonadetes bacterium]|nr:hypothetical protein [Armatimonadota bacterium]